MYKSLQHAAALLLVAGPALAGAGALREMSTDRPDSTESPYTVDAGHVQWEMDFINGSRDREEGATVTAFEAVPFNLRFGLTPRSELGFFLVPYHTERETDASGGRETRSGIGDLTVRGKWNFFGNDDGGPALGLIVDVKLPTAARRLGNGAVEGAVLLPFAGSLAGGWGVGAMTGVDLQRRETGRGYRAAWINTVTVSHDLTEKVGGYLELTSAAGAGAHVATFDTGLTYGLDANTQFDVGVQLGLSRSADDVAGFIGVARRY